MNERAWMELIYIADDGFARQTNMSSQRATDAQTRAAFDGYRRLEVPNDKARFLLDYHDANGDLADTILLDARGFEEITGQKPKTDAEYCAIDHDFWVQVRADWERDRTALQETADG